MAERIYYRYQGQGSEPLEEELFGSENALQKVTADYRKFLNGNQLRPDTACHLTCAIVFKDGWMSSP